VLDSDGPDEYRECLLKAEVVTNPPQKPPQDKPLHLIETMRLTASGDITRLDLHLARLSRSAQALRFPFYRKKVYTALRTLTLSGEDQRLRMALFKTGRIDCDVTALTDMPSPLRLAISKNPLTPQVQDTRHKVSARDFYDSERTRLSALCGADEVLFLNPDGELCEGSFTSLFIAKDDGTYLTPDIRCGLLPGVLRAEMLVTGQAKSAILTLTDLNSANIYAGNSLRGLMPASLISPTPV